MKDITVAILAKDKGYCLPFYLTCLLNQTVDPKRINLYIRTNDNKDDTETILENFIEEYGDRYKSVYYDNCSIDMTLQQYEEHEWNEKRFKILGAIRQESVEYAKVLNNHYFVADCDNFIGENTLQRMYDLRAIGVIAPYLRLSNNHYYSNYHFKACPLGYYEQAEGYFPVWERKIKGLIEVDTVHCTYFIPHKFLSNVVYDDLSGRYEYAIMADHLRKRGVKQYLDNSEIYGLLFLDSLEGFDVTYDSFINDHWKNEYDKMSVLKRRI